MAYIKSICFGLTLIMCFYLASCYDNSVVNNELPFSFDSVRFSVTYKKSTFPLNEAYIIDTDKIFLADISGFEYYKNGEFHYTSFNFNFSSLYIDGFNENNVYMCGYEYLSDNLTRHKIIKWNGTNFEPIQMEDTVSGKYHKFSHIYCKSLNEIWLGGEDGTAWKYDGNKFTKHLLDTNYVGNETRLTYLMNDGFDNLCCVQIEDSVNNNLSIRNRHFKFYKLNSNEEFELLSSKVYFNTDGPAFPKKVGNKMYTVSKEGLFEFDGYIFTKITDIGPIEDPLMFVAGTDPNDIMIAGRISNIHTPCLYHWNGKKWSMEDKFLSYTNFTSYLTYVKDMYVCVDYAPEYATFIKFLKR